MLTTATLPSRVGSLIDGRYELVRLIGTGGMSEVYEARHIQLGRKVALKLLLPQLVTAPDVLARFLNEAHAAGSLQHDNIAAVYDAGEDPAGAPYLVMEYLQGRDCAETLRTLGRFAPGRATALAIQACRGLAEIHGHGIIHRDLKPANLFLTVRSDGAELVKVLDFGIAKLHAGPAFGVCCTRVGEVVGTPYYMSPEQAMGDASLDLRTDVYSLGVVLFEWLTGCKPFEGDCASEIVHQLLTREVPRVDQLCADVPRGLGGVVAQAMSRSREQRFDSMHALRLALENYCATAATRAMPARLPSQLPTSATSAASARSTPQRFTQPAPVPQSRSRSQSLKRKMLWPLTLLAVVLAAAVAGLLHSASNQASELHSPQHVQLQTAMRVRPAAEAPAAQLSPAPSAELAAVRAPPICLAKPADLAPDAPAPAGVAPPHAVARDRDGAQGQGGGEPSPARRVEAAHGSPGLQARLRPRAHPVASHEQARAGSDTAAPTLPWRELSVDIDTDNPY